MSIVRVDLTKLKGAMLAEMPSRADMERLMAGIAAAVRQRWVAKAQQGLHSTARDYIAGLQQPEIEGGRATIVLTGVLPNLVEHGMSAFDMRTTLLGPNSKAKTSADGHRYNTIPFRHGSAGSSGRNTGRPMPRSIHDAARSLLATVSRPKAVLGLGGGEKTVRYGERLQAGDGSKKAQAILATKMKPWHWGSIYLGMIRQEKTYAKSTQNSYSTFRRISTKVSRGPQHWFHPGITASNFGRQVSREVGSLVSALLPGTLQRQK